jgi:RND family efflux transporter MFP subunit
VNLRPCVRRRMALPASGPGRILLAVLAAAALAAAFAVARPGVTPPDGGGSEAGPPVEVDVVTLAERAPDDHLVLPGRVEARAEMTLTARLAGRVTHLPLREGGSFRAGETLARFAAPEATGALRAARARLAAAESGTLRAGRQEARVESLQARGVVALRDLEVAREAARGAEAGLSAARAELARWNTDTRLTAPFAGVVVRRRVDEGADVAAGQALLELRSHAAGEVAADLPESFLGAVDRATFEVRVGEGAWLAARLVRVEGMVAASSRTRRAYFAPEDAAAADALEPGAFARVRISAPELRAAGADVASTPRSVLVPSGALVRRGGLSGVFVVSADRARLRWVRLGRVAGGNTEIAAGLLEGDRIVLEPAGLLDGQPVRPR